MRALIQRVPQEMLTAKQTTLWKLVAQCMGRGSHWLAVVASKLISDFLQQCVLDGSTTIPFKCRHGLRFDEDLCLTLLRVSWRAIKRETSGDALSQAVLPNLLFLVKVLDAQSIKMTVKKQKDDQESSEEDVGDEIAQQKLSKTTISTTRYMIDQAARVMRKEPNKQTSAALQPKISTAIFLQSSLSHLNKDRTTQEQDALVGLLIPLLHMTSTTTSVPRSKDADFAVKYQELVEQCQLVMDGIQALVGDREYTALVTTATRLAREKRQERRAKRAIETIAEPERAAQDKRRRFEKKKERRKEISGMYRGHRRKDLGF